MITAIESELYRISKNKNYDNGDAYTISVKDTESHIIVFKDELSELIELLTKATEIL